jgi:hypothetical protein
MFWNYRIIEYDEIFYIHEVYYNDNGNISAISEDPMHPQGKTLNELKGDMEYFLQAFNRPGLKKEEIKFAPMDGVDSKPVNRKTKRTGKPLKIITISGYLVN